MSQTPQGPGWWVASDGQWYPPEQRPGLSPLVADRGAPQPVMLQQPPTTSGMAVASLVLSLVWLGGIGSILGIIFGFVGRNEIQRANGSKSGGGMAIAGITIGFVGLAGIGLVILAVVALGTAVNSIAHELQPRTVAFGTTVNISSGLDPGLKSMTVSTLTIPPRSGAPKGDAVAVARVTVCADNRGSHASFNALLLSAYFADGSSSLPNFSATVRGAGPNLLGVHSIAANRCVSGYMPFDITAGTHPAGVEYDIDIFRIIRWTR